VPRLKTHFQRHEQTGKAQFAYATSPPVEIFILRSMQLNLSCVQWLGRSSILVHGCGGTEFSASHSLIFFRRPNCIGGCHPRECSEVLAQLLETQACWRSAPRGASENSCSGGSCHCARFRQALAVQKKTVPNFSATRWRKLAAASISVASRSNPSGCTPCRRRRDIVNLVNGTGTSGQEVRNPAPVNRPELERIHERTGRARLLAEGVERVRLCQRSRRVA
jgi:hypothetical protein